MKFLESISWYAYRLRAMKPAEVIYRCEERWKQATQATFLKSLEGFDPGPPSSQALRLPYPADAMAELCVQLAEDAARLQGGNWQLFGWRDVEVGAPPCWHRDAFCGVVIDPDKPAHQLNHRRLPDGADARTIWEINRWTEMTRLAMHGWLNADLSAIRKAQLWLEDWCERNPPGLGINWTSPLEVALRLINFVWFDALVEAAMKMHGEGNLKASQASLVKRIVPVHAGWVWRYRSAGSSANNHLLGELAALMIAVSRWPQLEKIACSVDVAWGKLGREVLHQFAADGGSREQALHYHLFAFDLAWQAVRAVGCRAGEVYERLVAAAGYFQALAQGAEPWDFGDNDDAQVVPVTQRRSRAVDEWLNWFRGQSGVLRFWLGEAPPAKAESPGVHFPGSGMAALRSKGWVARADASPLGFGALAAHGHGDALHVSVWDGERALLIDPGTGGYYGYPELRAELAAWEAHNGPLPQSGYSTPQRMGAFLWARHHESPILNLEQEGLSAQFDHEGHLFRRMLRVSGESIHIQDTESAKKAFVVCWTFSPECQVKEMTPNTYTVEREGFSWSVKIDGMRSTVEERRVSPAYGCITISKVLRVESQDGTATLTIHRQY